MKDLVQELRELAEDKRFFSDKKPVCVFPEMFNCECIDYTDCSACVADTMKMLADRIEREYDPKPEPDTVEKVALEMLEDFEMMSDVSQLRAIVVDTDRPKTYRKRLEALGVEL